MTPLRFLLLLVALVMLATHPARAQELNTEVAAEGAGKAADELSQRLAGIDRSIRDRRRLIRALQAAKPGEGAGGGIRQR